MKTYFVSSGFAFVYENSHADVCAVEAVEVDELDADLVKSGLQVSYSRMWLICPHGFVDMVVLVIAHSCMAVACPLPLIHVLRRPVVASLLGCGAAC